MKLVFLDVKTIGDDLDLSPFDQFGEVVKYSFSAPSEVPGRIQDADVIIVNKIQINETTIGSAKNLKLVCVTATGTNNLDKDLSLIHIQATEAYAVLSDPEKRKEYDQFGHENSDGSYREYHFEEEDLDEILRSIFGGTFGRRPRCV